MILKNKKTGEIGDLQPYGNDGRIWVWIENTSKPGYRYDSLAELNEEWEDAPEEPKEYWFINSVGEIILPSDTTDWEQQDATSHNEIGNYFETKEEAELAVRKLKAWKRLKDKGFDIEGWDNHIGDNYYKTGQIVINLNNVKNRDWNEYDNISEIKDDLDLLFSEVTNEL